MNSIFKFVIALTVCAFVISVFPTAAVAEMRTAPNGMKYIFQPPKDFDEKKPVNMYVCLHGAGSSPEKFMTVFNAYMKAGGKYLVIAIEATKPGYYAPGDEDKMLDVIKDLKKKYRIGHIIFFGFSRGAGFSMMFAFKYPKFADGVIACGGNNPYGPAVYKDPAAAGVAVYLIHGTADNRVPISNSREAMKGFRNKKFKWAKLDEVPGLAHNINSEAMNRGHKWLVNIFKKYRIGLVKLTKEEIAEKMKAVKEGIDKKEYEKALEALDEVAGQMESRDAKEIEDKLEGILAGDDADGNMFALKAAGCLGKDGFGLLKKQLGASKKDEKMYLAVIEALGGAGDQALSKLHSILKSRDYEYRAAAAAAEAIGRIGSKKSVKQLLKILKKIERSKGKMDALTGPVNAALKTITGGDQATYKEWMTWLKKGGK